MPSLDDALNDVNARLDLIVGNTTEIYRYRPEVTLFRADTGPADPDQHPALAQLDNSCDHRVREHHPKGYLRSLEVERASLNLLDHHRPAKRYDHLRATATTTICSATSCASWATCWRIERSVPDLQPSASRGFLERVHCCEAAEYNRNLELQRRIEECCPPRSDSRGRMP